MGYQSRYCEIAYKHCLAGATTEQLADAFHETIRTVEEWIADIPEFRDAVDRGRNADGEVERTLYRLIDGYDEEVVRVVVRGGEPTIQRHTRRHPPKPSLVARR
jgi:hypothetical protein